MSMKYIFTLIMICCAMQGRAQSDDGLLTANKLALDTTISGAVAFNNELLICVPGYTYKFVDRSANNELRYLYEHTSRETLKIEYALRTRETDTAGRPKPIVFSQRIIADNATIAGIYNCTFGEHVKPEELAALSGTDQGFIFRDRDYHYSLMPDDYKPGYWVLTFSE
jgi:hypothetical protein